MKKIYISIGNACNLRCKFCYNDEERNTKQYFKDFGDIEKEILSIQNPSNYAVIIVGGEPLLYPHIFEMLDKIYEHGFYGVWLVTNGIKLNDDEIVKKLVKYPNFSIEISIHSNSGGVDDNITQRKGNFQRRESGVKNLLKHKKSTGSNVYIHVNTVVNSDNLLKIDEILRYIYSLGLKNISLACIYNLKGFSNDNFNNVIKYSDLIEKIPNITDLLDKDLNLHLNWLPLCLHYNEKLINLKYKIRETYSELNGDGEENKSRFKIVNDKCLNCYAYGKYCRGIFKFYIEKYGDDEFFPLSEEKVEKLINKSLNDKI